MESKSIIGVDISYSSTGIAWEEGGVVKTTTISVTKEKQSDALIGNILACRAWVDKFDNFLAHNSLYNSILYVEDYAFGAKGSAVTAMAELGGLSRNWFIESDIKFVLVGVGENKKFLTGKGNAKKDMMLKEVYKRYGIDVNTNDEADAVSLLMFGKCCQDISLCKNQNQTLVVSSFLKSYGKKKTKRKKK